MALTTYDELKASLADWLLRSDLTAVIPDFITLTEAELNRELRHWKMEERTTLSLSSQYTALPSDFLGVGQISVTDSNPYRMELITRSEMQFERELDNDTSGRPIFYAITDGQLEVYPTPDQSYSADMAYTQAIDPLSASNASNWVLSDHPDLYLYGALCKAAPYLHQDERINVWMGLYQKALNDANIASDKAKYSGTGLRMKVGAY